MKLRSFLRYAAIFLILLCGVSLILDRWVAASTSDRIYTQIEQVPARTVGLVLGTSKYIAHNLNPYYNFRMDAAVELYREKKIQILLLSGDNAHRSYNEPWTMKRDLLKANIPDEVIVLDYAGFRTLDSVMRARDVFEANSLTIITQRFHCERALFIAEHKQIDAICLAVPAPHGVAGFKIRLREVLARVKAWLDLYVLDEQPRFPGPKEPIFTPPPQPETTPPSPLNS
ncbi:YdcF family protein [Photobacterium sp. GJ3]|uniref:SanA/YdcF family protein n=1 Tax=Photobacterium sp. GJ3 TaxID=2829502 RepID=UPI001B8D3201|nr:ElyC/SanA/YdcF family protein [Photobacterium sp. GJ3]QUJ68776.1 YdcF family protein [Photobacterium sp. GJ3]